MSAADLAKWRTWYDLEPRGDERADYHAALIAMAVWAQAEGTSIADMLGRLRSCWDAELGEAEKVRRQQQKHLKTQKALNTLAAQARQIEDLKRARADTHGKHRQVERAGGG